ncbi:hypothetical protein C0J52_04831 [Blattella germanica]|nr:hypothetical protein C0J52_04831 [Blattella germanica]
MPEEDLTALYTTEYTQFPTFPDWLVTWPPLWFNPYPKIPFLPEDDNEHTYPTEKTPKRKKFLGPLRRILRRFSEKLSSRLENMSNKVRNKGVNKPRNVVNRKFRMLIERFLKRHPLARGVYHVLKLPENIVAYFRPKNAIKRAISNVLSYASDVALDPVRRQDDGIFKTLLHRLSRILKAINYNRPKNVRKRVIGVPILWKWTMGPPDSTQFYVIHEGNATTSTSLDKIEEDVVCDHLGCNEEPLQNVNSTELTDHKQGDIIMCSGLECVQIQLSY